MQLQSRHDHSDRAQDRSTSTMHVGVFFIEDSLLAGKRLLMEFDGFCYAILLQVVSQVFSGSR